jgi:hypothetical protein
VSKQAPRKERDFDTVLDDDIRPAGNGKDCFYCANPLGSKHEPDCVIRWGAGYYNVHLRNNETGEVRVYREDSVWNGTNEFMWSEGNFSCDCNRAMMFQRAIDEEQTWDHDCGDQGYSVLRIVLPDGREVYNGDPL